MEVKKKTLNLNSKVFLLDQNCDANLPQNQIPCSYPVPVQQVSVDTSSFQYVQRWPQDQGNNFQQQGFANRKKKKYNRPQQFTQQFPQQQVQQQQISQQQQHQKEKQQSQQQKKQPNQTQAQQQPQSKSENQKLLQNLQKKKKNKNQSTKIREQLQKLSEFKQQSEDKIKTFLEDSQKIQQTNYDMDISKESIEKRKKILQQQKDEEQFQKQLIQKQIMDKEQEIQQQKEKIKSKKQQRFDFLIKVQKEAFKYRKDHNMLQQIPRKKKYKAISDVHENEIKLELKRSKKQSKIRQNLKQFKEDQITKSGIDPTNPQNLAMQVQTAETKQSLQDGYETLYELTDTEQTVYKLKVNIFQGQYYNNMVIREWVDHILCRELDEKVKILINKLSYSQKMKKLKEPQKFKQKIVAGYKQVLKTVRLNLPNFSSRLVIFAINQQFDPLKGGINELVNKIISECKMKQIPVIHSSSRRWLGMAYTGQFGVKISCVSIVNYQGQEELFQELIELANQKRQEFILKLKDYSQQQ